MALTKMLLLSFEILHIVIGQETRDYCENDDDVNCIHPSTLLSNEKYSTELSLISNKVSELYTNVQHLEQRQHDLMEQVVTLKNENKHLQDKVDLLNATKEELPPPESCSDIYESGETQSGEYFVHIKPRGYKYPRKVKVFCDMETAGGGWTVFQRRFDGSVPFDRVWDQYKRGFGNISGEFWMGNDILSVMTSYPGSYRLRIELKSFDNLERYAEYGNFMVSSESEQYKLQIGTYSGNAGDGGRGLSDQNGMKFTTTDRDNDRSSYYNCASIRGDGGFWYDNCDSVNMNSEYKSRAVRADDTIQWEAWLGTTALKATEMKFRPNIFPLM